MGALVSGAMLLTFTIVNNSKILIIRSSFLTSVWLSSSLSIDGGHRCSGIAG